MNKQEKGAEIDELSQKFGRAAMAVVSEYKGMTAAQATELRRRLRAVRGELRVAKNTLVRRAIKGTPFEALDQTLGGPVGVILSFEDPVAVAKTITSFKEAGDKLKLRAGVLAGRPITAADVQALATLPPKEVVMGQLLGLLQAPGSQLVRLLNEPGSALARVIDAIGKKNGERGDPASVEQGA
jgi:ribosomal protein L10